MTLLTDNPFGNFFDDAFPLASWQLLVYISSILSFNEAISRHKFLPPSSSLGIQKGLLGSLVHL